MINQNHPPNSLINVIQKKYNSCDGGISNRTHGDFKKKKLWILLSQDGIEKYDKTNLTHTETMEKNTLPTKEVIAMEKSA